MAGNRFNGFLAGVAGTGHGMIHHGSLSPTRSCPISWWSDTSTVGRGIETVETVSMSPAPDGTPLMRGVNERFAAPGVSGSNPKPEGRRPKEGRNPKVEARTALGLRFRTSDFGIRPSFGLRASGFGFHLSSAFELRPAKSSAVCWALRFGCGLAALCLCVIRVHTR